MYIDGIKFCKGIDNLPWKTGVGSEATKEAREDQLKNAVNSGNFLELMQLLARTDETLREHLLKPKFRNATYLSPQGNTVIQT